jgi:low affinity Fe/Cu permease
MTVLRTDPDLRAPAFSTREESSREKNEGQLSALQVAAGALAAVSAAVAASFFGVAGTVIGAAVASVVSTVGAAVYTESMRRTHAGLRRAGSRLVRRPQSPVDRSGGGRPPRPARLDPRRGPLRRRWRRWAMVAATGVAVFGLAMVVVTTVELIGHKPVSALVGDSDRSGGTTLGSLTDATGGDSRQQQAPASPSTTPTDGTAPASDSPPTPTSGDESTATSGAESTAPSAPTTSAPHSAPAPPTAPAEELPATPAPEQSASAPSQAGSNAEPGQPSSGVDSSP